MNIDRVLVMVRRAKELGKMNEKFCNGDYHPANKLAPADKNKNAELWAHAIKVGTQELLRYVETYGFTDVIYTGLGPTLKRGERFVEIPY